VGLIYLDSCLVIYAVEDESARGDMVRQKMSDGGAVAGVVSALVTMECLVGPLKEDDLVLHDQYVRALALFDRAPLGEEQFMRAAALRARHGLKAMDALHLAAAQMFGCKALWTGDARLAAAAPGFALNVLA
jgi:predicted nucleic acid-binding protein